MSDGVEDMATAWRAASADLGIDVTAPFLVGDSDKACPARVFLFGAAQGTVVDVLGAQNHEVRAFAASEGMHYSELSDATYSRYDRATFVAALNDWRWYGDPAEAPEWYTGEPWTT